MHTVAIRIVEIEPAIVRTMGPTMGRCSLRAISHDRLIHLHHDGDPPDNWIPVSCMIVVVARPLRTITLPTPPLGTAGMTTMLPCFAVTPLVFARLAINTLLCLVVFPLLRAVFSAVRMAITTVRLCTKRQCLAYYFFACSLSAYRRNANKKAHYEACSQSSFQYPEHFQSSRPNWKDFQRDSRSVPRWPLLYTFNLGD